MKVLLIHKVQNMITLKLKILNTNRCFQTFKSHSWQLMFHLTQLFTLKDKNYLSDITNSQNMNLGIT